MSLKFLRISCGIAVLVVASAAISFGQAAKPEPAKTVSTTAASSPAYAELLLKKTELQSDLESLILEYTEEFPKVKEIRHVLTLVDRDTARLSKVKATDTSRLTLALGKLMVRRIELETDLWKLQGTYKDEHPEVKRAKRKIEIYESAIGEILN